MKKIILLINVFCIVNVVAIAQPQIQLKEIPFDTSISNLPMIPWVIPGDSTWFQGKPVFEVANEKAKTSARGWIAVTNENILIKIRVNDNMHLNHQSEANIWDGDAIQLGLDAGGDGTGSLAENTAFTGPDDASITFALTDQGPQAWAHYHGRPGGVGALPHLAPHIVRDEKAQVTTYHLKLPWQEFQWAAGISPLMGMAVQINDADEDNDVRLYWGYGAGGALRPGLFNQLVLDRPPAEVFSACCKNSEIWRKSCFGEIILAVASNDPLAVRATLQDAEQAFELPKSSLHAGIRRFSVRGLLKTLPEDSILFMVNLIKNNKEQVVSQKASLNYPGKIIEQFSGKIDSLISQSTHPLLTFHLASTEALVKTQWALASTQFDANPQLAREIIGFVKRMNIGLTGDAAQWETYRNRRRSLVLAFISENDNTLQHYRLNLPQNWQSTQVYPMIVNLHGAGNPHPLNDVASSFDSLTTALPKNSFPGEFDTFVLYPWGRGNQGYRDWAQDDVWEAIDAVKKRFKIDENRVYLMGHSMGGGGTWAIGLRTPDRWAAIAICAGGPWSTPLGVGIEANASGLPVRILHGDRDNAVSVKAAYRMDQELRENGQTPDLVIAEGEGHQLSAAQWQRTVQWLLQHTRQRPDRFSFVADTDKFTGRNGIFMRRDLKENSFPRFDCEISGNTVNIKTKGTSKIWVILGDEDFGQEGLGLTGEVTVILNEKEVYRGPVKTLELEVKAGESQ